MTDPMDTEQLEFTQRVQASDVGLLVDYLVEKTGIARRRVKDAISKGAVWVQRGKGERRRVRRSNYMLRLNDDVQLFYNHAYLNVPQMKALCIADTKQYSVWFKPANMPINGSQYGDHNSLDHQIETFFSPSRERFYLSPLGEVVAGLVLVAHSSSVASKLEVLVARHRIEKHYYMQVEGETGFADKETVINEEIDGKPARTVYRLLSLDRDRDVSTLEAWSMTDRPSQFQQHFASIGHPIVEQNERLHIVGVAMHFDCPIMKKAMIFTLDEKHKPFGVKDA